jgi:hypothetical protein
MPNIFPSYFVASTTAFMAYIYSQYSGQIMLVISVIVVSAVAGMLIAHLKK